MRMTPPEPQPDRPVSSVFEEDTLSPEDELRISREDVAAIKPVQTKLEGWLPVAQPTDAPSSAP